MVMNVGGEAVISITSESVIKSSADTFAEKSVNIEEILLTAIIVELPSKQVLLTENKREQ